jgi:tetratricopeptide (TPR) repeat protein
MTEIQPVRFGKYLLLNKIAIGGMAELFQAKITSVEGFEKLVAIKRILPHLAEDEELVNMFIDEAKLAAMLTHQNIVQIYDLGSMENTYFIAMEYIHGKDLLTILSKSREERRPLPPEYALYIASRICAGLAYSHNLKDFQGIALNLIHRDISPQNILVTYEGEVKIVDFGIAKAAKRRSGTRVGMIKGKVAYMSPEQAAGQSIDNRSDIFSTGILLYEMLTGKRMFEGTDLEILRRVRKTEFIPLESMVTDLPPRLYEVLHRALSQDPELRYQSCTDMLTALDECMSAFPVRPSAELLGQHMKLLFSEEIAAEVTALKQAGQPAGPAHAEKVNNETTITQHQAPETRIERGRTRRGQRLLLGGAALAAVIIATVLGLFFLEQSPLSPGADTEAGAESTLAQPLEAPVMPAPAVDLPERLPEGPLEEAAAPRSGQEEALQALRDHRFARAAALFEEMLQRAPEVMPHIGGYYVQALMGQAATIMQGEPEQAEALLLRAIEVEPRNARSYFSLGRVYTAQENYPKAIDAYRKAMELEPEFPDAFFNLGFVYAMTHEFAEAEQMFAKVVDLAPSYLDEAYFNLAMVQRKQGKEQQSIRNLEHALESNPDNAKARRYLLRFTGRSEGAR